MNAPPRALPRAEIDGSALAPDARSGALLGGYGHFTAMQVRDGKVRGLDLHLARLDAANREMFGEPLDGALIRRYIRHALGDDVADASVRVAVRESADRPAVVVTIRPPGDMGSGPWRLRAVPYQRSLAHLKHASDFGQAYYQRQVLGEGYDEALLTGQDGLISEGSITNVVFYDGAAFVWPAAPALRGITMQLIEQYQARAGLASRREHVRVSDLPAFAAMFVTNSHGIAPVAQVDGLALPVRRELTDLLAAAYESAGWDEI